MKFATYKNESRDGILMLVSRDLARACEVSDIAPTMQHALDNWQEVAPQLQSRYEQLNDNVGELSLIHI